jgi:hypothetical protein
VNPLRLVLRGAVPLPRREAHRAVCRVRSVELSLLTASSRRPMLGGMRP